MRSADAVPPPSLPFLVGALFAGHTCSAMALFVLPTVAPEVAREFHIPAATIGYQISLASVGMLATLALLGNMSRRLGACRTNQAGHACVAAAMCTMLLPSLACIVLGSLLLGVGYGLLTPSASGLLMRFTPAARRNVIFSLQQTGVPLGGILVASIAPTIAIHFGWRTALVAIACLILAVVCALEAGRRRWDDDRDPRAPLLPGSPLAPLAAIWAHPALRQLSLAGCAFCWWQFVVAAFTVVACVEGLGMSLVAAGFVLTVVQVAGIAARILCGWFADRLRSATRALAGLAVVWLVACIASAGLSPAWPFAAVCVLFALYGATSNGWPGAVLAEVGKLARPGDVSTTIAAALVYINLGKLVGPVVTTNIVTLGGTYGMAFASVAIPAALALLWLRKARH